MSPTHDSGSGQVKYASQAPPSHRVTSPFSLCNAGRGAYLIGAIKRRDTVSGFAHYGETVHIS